MTPERLKQFAVARVNGVLALDEGWRFKLDPEQQGEKLGYQNAGFDDSALGHRARRRRLGEPGLRLRRHGLVPQGDRRRRRTGQGARLRLIADGIDDAYTVWVNGKAIATHGSFTDHDETVWLKQTVTDLTGCLIPGQQNTLALQVVDITGQGGIFKPLYITTE